jgi:hypothetical protein
MVGKKSPVPHDHSHYHFSVMHCHAKPHARLRPCGNRLLETGGN